MIRISGDLTNTNNVMNNISLIQTLLAQPQLEFAVRVLELGSDSN